MLLALRSQVELVAQGGDPAPLPSIGLLLAPANAGAISGTASLSFGQTGTLAGSGALASSAAIVFGQSGALTGSGSLAGSSAITLGQSGALTAQGALAGSSALTFSQTGSLAGSGALSGTAPLTFSQSGTLDQPAGALSGSADITFSISATLAANGSLAGTAGMSFAASATADLPAGSQQSQAPAGRSGPARRRRLYVEIDGQQFDVESADQAQALLDRAKQLAQATAPEQAEERLTAHLATNPRIRPKIERPHIITDSPELQAMVRQARAVISDLYKAAYRDAEIKLRLEAKLAEDEADDEDLMMML